MKNFLRSNSLWARLGRTILQGIIGVLISYIDLLVGFFEIPPELRPMIVALVMCVLSPIMKELGGGEDDNHANSPA